MRQWIVAAALLVATFGVTAATASVPTVPSPSAHKAPPKSGARKPPVAKKDPKVLREAVDSADEARLNELFYRKGYSVSDFVDDERNTPLHRIAELCNLPLQTRLQLIKGFVAMGGDLRGQNKWGDTPLVIAKAKCGGPPAVLAMLTATTPTERADQKARGEEWWQRGNQAMNSGSLQQGLAAYLEAEKADPTNPTYYNAVAMTYERMGDWEAAVRELQVAAGLGHQIGIFQTNLDYAMQQLRDQQTPQGKARTLLLQADQLRTSGANQQAIALYDQARGLDGSNAAIYNGEGVAYYQLGNYAAAEWAFRMALQIDPNNPTIRTNLQNAQQQIAAANLRSQQMAQQAAQQRAAQQQAAEARARQQQQARNNDFLNTVTQGLALGYQIGQANRPPPQPAYRPPPNQQVASAAPRSYGAPQNTPQSAPPAAAARPAVGVASNCVTVEPPPPGGGSFYRVVNRCAVSVIGEFCYDNDRYFACGPHAGGFGPIRPGGFEAVSGPSNPPAMAHTSYCNYDDWNRSLCKILQAGPR